ncbi:hypothetical protein [Variovorax sp. OV329]|uniref:hypothetical protein n=1 Tax=Variovorax sp. OV329 TaxID=1882825 RepID=UPI0008E45098|nr:hypothetical protein [Variovorax sp. OV329]SFM88518.1 hypothetical protein SAMN05444747_110142 [Variovorax sp. OV329]
MKAFNLSLTASLTLALLATGCSTLQQKTSSDTTEAPKAAAAPAEPPAPKLVRRKQATGLTADQVNQALATKNAAKIRSALVGKTVTVELAKGDGKSWQSAAVEGVSFACRASEAGFDGGEVSARVRSYKAATKSQDASLELDNCASNFALESTPAPAAAASAPAPAATTAPAKAAAPAAAATGGVKPGMDAQGNVIDSSKVEGGSGRTVKGINDFEGEITGNPARNSKFSGLQIGMSMKQVTDIAGQPTDSGAYMTGKAWIPFYFGGDRHRMELTYKGQGRLIFAGGSLGNYTGGNLIWIIHNPNESGYR